MVKFTNVGVGIVSVPETIAPVIPAGIVAVQLKVTFPVVRLDKRINELSLPEQSV